MPLGRNRSWLWWIASAAVIVVMAGALPFVRRPEGGAAAPATLLILPMENATGDPGDDFIATGLAGDVAERLSALKALTIKASTNTQLPVAVRDSIAKIAPRFGVEVVLRSRLVRSGDSLQAEASVVDLRTGYSRSVAVTRFGAGDLRNAASQLAAAVAGAVFGVPLPEVPRLTNSSVDPEAFKLTLLGWHLLLARSNPAGARALFLQATKIDPLFARAWSGLSSTWAAAAATGQVPFDEGFALAEAAASRALALDSLQGSAWANLGLLHALMARNLDEGEPFFARAMAAEPSNAELFMVHASLLSFAWQWDRARDAGRVARRLDPLTAYYAGREASLEMCAGRPADALRLYRAQLDLDADDREGHLGVARSLAQLGRWDEAILALQALARSRNDTALARLTASARGEAGYWLVKHAEGRLLLEQRLAAARQHWTAPFLVGVAEIGAGNLDEGLTILEAELRAGSRMVYKLACNPEIDEVRSLPRFQQLLRAAGPLPGGSVPR